MGTYWGELRWNTPNSVGTYHVVFSYEGHTYQQQLRLVLPQAIPQNLHTGSLVLSALNIETTTSGCDIYLNGKLAGESPLLIEGLPQTPYTITVKKIGYATNRENSDAVGEETCDILITIRRLGSSPRPQEPTPRPSRPIHPVLNACSGRRSSINETTASVKTGCFQNPVFKNILIFQIFLSDEIFLTSLTSGKNHLRNACVDITALVRKRKQRVEQSAEHRIHELYLVK